MKLKKIMVRMAIDYLFWDTIDLTQVDGIIKGVIQFLDDFFSMEIPLLNWPRCSAIPSFFV